GRDIGALAVRRVLPSRARRLVGPFIYFDEMGPVELAPGAGLDVPPHPHIGLATVTYLFEGEFHHRDSLGTLQAIRPGEINWMTAGRGIVHSERTGPELRRTGSRTHGLQLWVALPKEHEEIEPSFQHHAADALPVLERDGARLRVLAGSAFGATSPVRTLSQLLYVDAELPAGCELELPREPQERAVYVAVGEVVCGAERAGPGRMLVLTPGAGVRLRAVVDTRLVLIGGVPLDGERHISWNFVSSSPERIERARHDWRERRFPLIPGDDTEFVPLPG
ncbi:MAG TPA: pirin family protein, partial [Planctomycetota bacterium]|nr:pirin family protein [Planctomycetota bacterium]